MTNNTPSPDFRCTDGQAANEATGLPLVFYHGTPVFDNGMGDVVEFDRLWTIRNIKGRQPSIDNVGIWFSTNFSDEGGAGMYAGPTGAIYPVHLSITNPYVTTFDALVQQMHRLNGDHEKAQAATLTSKGNVESLRQWLRDTGRDGIKIIHDPHSPRASTEFLNQEAWIALEPYQIRFAIGHSTCDSDNQALARYERQRA